MSNTFSLPTDWEKRLERTLHLCKGVPNKHKAYICSPCHSSDIEEMHDNIIAARFYMYYVSTQMTYHARAPHAYLGFLLDDDDNLERAMALKIGQDLLISHGLIFVCGDRISTGMRAEIESAARLDMPVHCFNKEVYPQICSVVEPLGMGEVSVYLDETHVMLGKAPRSLINEGVL